MLRPIHKSFLLMLVLVLADQGVKIWVRAEIPLHAGSVLVPNLIDLTHVENKGVSFSFLGNLDEGLRAPLLVGISLFAVSVLGYYWWSNWRGLNFYSNLAFMLILPGAMGNLIDRIIYGTVTDYFHFKFYSTSFFVNNLADIFISAGVVAYLIGMWQTAKKPA